MHNKRFCGFTRFGSQYIYFLLTSNELINFPIYHFSFFGYFLYAKLICLQFPINSNYKQISFGEIVVTIGKFEK